MVGDRKQTAVFHVKVQHFVDPSTNTDVVTISFFVPDRQAANQGFFTCGKHLSFKGILRFS